MADSAVITAERLRAILHYDPETGIWTWLIAASNNVKVGDIAGSEEKQGYWVIVIGSRRYKAHRLAWLYMTGEWPPRRLDHRNLKKSENQWCNLRLASNGENIANSGPRRDNSLGIKGVYRNKRRFNAQIRVRGKLIYLGSFATKEQAAQRHREAHKEIFGEFSRTA